MRIKNTLDYSDQFFRRLISWCCKSLEMPVRYVKQAEFTRTKGRAWSGRAYYHGRRIVVRVGLPSHFPAQTRRHRGGLQDTMADPIEALVHVTAHELAHLKFYREGVWNRQRSRVGSSEQTTDFEAFRVLEEFRQQRPDLLTRWQQEVNRPVKAKISLTETRHRKVDAKLKHWMRKLKLAQTKVRHYKKRLAYYERRAATQGD